MQYSLESHLSSHCTVTAALRPDILLVTEATKNITLVKLTVLWEDRMEEVQKKKKKKEKGPRMNNWSSSASSRAKCQDACPLKLDAEEDFWGILFKALS